ncbi:MAG: FUSC family protein [Prochlorococcus sp.]
MKNDKPLVQRHELRLAVISGLAAGFGLLSPLTYGYYLPVTVLAVLSSSYGTSLKLGVQRFFGSMLGWLLLLLFSKNMHLPLPLGMGMALASIRLLGGAFGLQVGYRVGGNIIVIGWLLHNNNELMWGPMRLFWTALGIVMSLCAVRWIWPSQAIPALHSCFADLLKTIGEDLQLQAELLEAETPQLTIQRRRERRQILLSKLQKTRQLHSEAQLELGINAEENPLHLLWCQLELLCSGLISSIDGLRGLPSTNDHSGPMEELHKGEARLLRASATLLAELSEQLLMPQVIPRQGISIKALTASTDSIKQEQADLENMLGLFNTIRISEEISRRMRLISLRALLVQQVASILLEFSTPSASSTPVSQSPSQALI